MPVEPLPVTSTAIVVTNDSLTSLDDLVSWLKRIESILRNGLPTDDKAEASTITHAHSEIELLLESINPDWWMK